MRQVSLLQRRRKVIHSRYKSLLNSCNRCLSSITPSAYIILPFIAILVFLILSVSITYVFYILSSSSNHHKNASTTNITDSDIQLPTSSITISRILSIAINQNPSSVHLHVLLGNQNKQTLNRAYARLVSQSDVNENEGKLYVSLPKLSAVLGVNCTAAIAPIERVKMSVPLHSAIASKSTIHALYRLIGHPRPASISFLVYSNAKPMPLLSKNKPDSPYTWRLGMATSQECKIKQRECEQIRDTLLTMYIAGCSALNDVDGLLVKKRETDTEQALGFATDLSCFNENGENEIIRDVWTRYAISTCVVSSGGIDRIRALASSSVHMAMRRRIISLLQWIDSKYPQHCP